MQIFQRARGAIAWIAVVASIGSTAAAPPAHAATQEPSSQAEDSKVGPIAKLYIYKSMHILIAVDSSEALVAAYTVSIGGGGAGFKMQEGDMTTPVGAYHVVLHTTTMFNEFLLLDYPNNADRKRFAELKHSGLLPAAATIGGNVGIHGTGGVGSGFSMKYSDWTAGCIALDNDEIRELARNVRDGTPVEIYR
jgi:murein L,D-transpeptidase YafK